MFEEFICSVYAQYLNDFNHLLTKHKDQVYEINQILIKSNDFNSDCDLKQCGYTTRHNSRETEIVNAEQMDTNKEHSKFKFFKQSVDSLHFYLIHLFQIGLRVHIDDETDEKENENILDQNLSKSIYFDAYSNRIHRCKRST